MVKHAGVLLEPVRLLLVGVPEELGIFSPNLYN
jgi:hypothetical protein